MEQGGATGAQERAPSAQPFLHSIRRTERSRFSAVAAPSVCLNSIRASVRAQRASMSACLSPAASRRGTERSDSGRRAGECLRFRRGRAWPRSGAECNGLKRRSQALPAAAVCEAISGGTDAQARASSPEQLIRSLPPLCSGRGGRALRRVWPGTRAASNLCERSEAGAEPCSRSGALPVSRPRRAGNVAKRSRSLRSVRESGVDVPVRAGVRLPRRTSPAMVRGAAGTRSVSDSERTLAGLGRQSNTLCRLRRLAGLTALRKTVPAGGEAQRAGGRLDALCEREARVPRRAALAARL
jgi:hypothetical protein